MGATHAAPADFYIWYAMDAESVNTYGPWVRAVNHETIVAAKDAEIAEWKQAAAVEASLRREAYAALAELLPLAARALEIASRNESSPELDALGARLRENETARFTDEERMARGDLR